MCLSVSKRITERVKAKGTITAYKLVQLALFETGPSRLVSVWEEFDYRRGSNRAVGRVRRSVRRGVEKVYGGAIHVFLSRRAARKCLKKSLYPSPCMLRIVKVRCEAEYLVAAGSCSQGGNSACYKKVWIEPEDYDKAIAVPQPRS